jgi:hypothetical protein
MARWQAGVGLRGRAAGDLQQNAPAAGRLGNRSGAGTMPGSSTTTTDSRHCASLHADWRVQLRPVGHGWSWLAGTPLPCHTFICTPASRPAHRVPCGQLPFRLPRLSPPRVLAQRPSSPSVFPDAYCTPSTFMDASGLLGFFLTPSHPRGFSRPFPPPLASCGCSQPINPARSYRGTSNQEARQHGATARRRQALKGFTRKVAPD